MSGRVQPTSAMSRVRMLFDGNPGEEYTFADLMTKFPDIRENSMREIVKNLRAKGRLVSANFYRSTNPAPLDPEIAHLRQRIAQLKAELAALKDKVMS